MIDRQRWMMGARAALLAALLAILDACGTALPPPQPEPPSGTIELNQTPLPAYSEGGGGTGTLFFQGRGHSFTISGLGIGGDGVAILQTTGEAYRLINFARFLGTYRQAPTEVVPNRNPGGLWLENANGVLLHLQPPPGGRIPPIGTDAVLVTTSY